MLIWAGQHYYSLSVTVNHQRKLSLSRRQEENREDVLALYPLGLQNLDVSLLVTPKEQCMSTHGKKTPHSCSPHPQRSVVFANQT